MLKELKPFPKEMQDAWKKIPNRPDENTPAAIMNFLDIDNFMTTYTNPFLINTIIDFADENLLDLELDIREKKDNIYQEFALVVIRKIMGLIDMETNLSKSLELYDNNPKVFKLKQKDFSKIGDLTGKNEAEKATIFAAFYNIQDDIEYTNLSEWEKRLFVDKATSRQNTNVEKKSPTL